MSSTRSGPPSDGAILLDEAGLDRLVDRLLTLPMPRPAPHEAGPPPSRRILIGIAGLPGSGKSTLASILLARLESRSPGCATLLPMDGFHYPNARLDALGLRARKGAPETFDARAYIDLLAAAADPHYVGGFPVYDRAAHEPVWRDVPAQRIEPAARFVLTEGNYLLLRRPPWSELASLLSQTWWLDTPAQTATAWLIGRHVRGGRTPDDARAFVQRSDAANIRLIQDESRPADLTLRWPGQETSRA